MRNDRNRADIFIALIVIAVIIFIVTFLRNAAQKTVDALTKLKEQKVKELERLKRQAEELDTLGMKLDRKAKRLVFIIKLALVGVFVGINIGTIIMLDLGLVQAAQMTGAIWSFIAIPYFLLCFMFSNRKISPVVVMRSLEIRFRKRLYRRHEYSPEKVQVVNTQIEEVQLELVEIDQKIKQTKNTLP